MYASNDTFLTFLFILSHPICFNKLTNVWLQNTYSFLITKSFFFFFFFVVLFESVIIGRTSKANASFVALNSAKTEKEIKFPYSILLAGIGILFAVIGWVLCVVMHCKLRKQGSQNTQDLDLSEAAMVSQDHDNTEDPNTHIIWSQARDLSDTNLRGSRCHWECIYTYNKYHRIMTSLISSFKL